jgi:hypothetical protein
MSKFVIGKPQTTDVPAISVDAGLAVGFHRFRLLVVDDQGNQSKPDEVVVEVRASRTTGGTSGGTTGGTVGGITTGGTVIRPVGVAPRSRKSVAKPK